MIRIKICGITNRADADYAVAAGADALGFIFYRPSPRYIAPDIAAIIRRDLPAFVSSVGVFVNEAPELICQMRSAIGFDTVQLSGDETPQDARLIGGSIIKAFRCLLKASELQQWQLAGYMADGIKTGHYGGTGNPADEDLIKILQPTGRLILAGGLDPGNVAGLCQRYKPYAVDVVSGTETAPGIKDSGKVTAFIKSVRSLGLA